MKKKDIVNLINSNLTLIKNKELLSTIKVNMQHDIYQNSSLWYPNSPKFNKSFEVLKQELLQVKTDSTNAKETISDLKCRCTHDVRLRYYSTSFSDNVCVLCGENTSSDNCQNFKESAFRNKHTVTFDSKNQEDDNSIYEIDTGKNTEEVLLMINDIIKDYNDEDDIDLVAEFTKLKLKNIEINSETRRKEKYILIIGGTNKEFIDESSENYITKQSQLSSYPFYKYFISLLNTKVAVLDTKETILVIDYNGKKDDAINSLDYYINIESLKYKLKSLRSVSFDLIINLSDLNEYIVENGKIIPKHYEINLFDIFPNSQIVNINKTMASSDLKEIKEILTSNNQSMVYTKSDIEILFYYLEENILISNNLPETCNYLKKLVRK